MFLAGIFLYLAIRQLDWAHFVSALRNADYRYMPILFLWGSLSAWIRADRWRILLNAEKQILRKNVFWANMAGYFGNNFLPARAGELIRAAYVSKENNIAAPFALATGLVERLVDLIALLLLAAISLQNAGIFPEAFRFALRIMSTIAAGGFICILLAPYVGHKLADRIALLQLPGATTREKLLRLLKQVLHGIGALHHPSRAAIFVLFTCIIWLMDGVGVLILARSLHLPITFAQSLLLLASLGLASAIPSTPGYVGVYQFVAVLVLPPFGVSNASALAFVILLQGASLLVILVWGAIAILRVARFSHRQNS